MCIMFYYTWSQKKIKKIRATNNALGVKRSDFFRHDNNIIILQ